MSNPLASVVTGTFGRRPDDLRLVAAELGSPMLALTLAGTSPVVRWANTAMLTLLRVPSESLVDHPLARQEPHPAAAPAQPELPHWSACVLDVVSGVTLAAGGFGTDQSGVEMDGYFAYLLNPDDTMSQVEVLMHDCGSGDWIVKLRLVDDELIAVEKAQRESEQRFRAMAENAPVGIVLSEAGLRLGFVNKRFAEITGVEGDLLHGTRWLDVIHSEDLPHLLAIIDEVLTGTAGECTVRVLSPSDSARWVEFRLSPVTTLQQAAGFIGTAEDITARRAWESRLAYQASHDPLTGLANRRSLMELLNNLLSSRRVQDRDFAVLFCDLDGFKEINDSLGHDAGDRVLIEVAQRLQTTAREQDMVARIAGDEFVVVVRTIRTVDDAKAAAERQLAGLVPAIHVGGRSVHVTASIGLALAGNYDDPATLLRAADTVMYLAKGSGPGHYVTDGENVEDLFTADRHDRTGRES